MGEGDEVVGSDWKHCRMSVEGEREDRRSLTAVVSRRDLSGQEIIELTLNKLIYLWSICGYYQ